MIDGRGWIAARFGEERAVLVGRFLDMVTAEGERQNLVAPSTIPTMWERHALDSAQLMMFDRAGETWLDIGTGGGFPGMIVALLREAPVVLVEPRRRRAEFLQESVDDLALDHVTIIAAKVEAYRGTAGIISARAVASTHALLQAAGHCADPGTRWVLPRGRNTQHELDDLRRHWHGMFHVEHSLSDPESAILILDGVRAR